MIRTRPALRRGLALALAAGLGLLFTPRANADIGSFLDCLVECDASEISECVVMHLGGGKLLAKGVAVDCSRGSKTAVLDVAEPGGLLGVHSGPAGEAIAAAFAKRLNSVTTGGLTGPWARGLTTAVAQLRGRLPMGDHLDALAVRVGEDGAVFYEFGPAGDVERMLFALPNQTAVQVQRVEGDRPNFVVLPLTTAQTAFAGSFVDFELPPGEVTKWTYCLCELDKSNPGLEIIYFPDGLPPGVEDCATWCLLKTPGICPCNPQAGIYAFCPDDTACANCCNQIPSGDDDDDDNAGG